MNGTMAKGEPTEAIAYYRTSTDDQLLGIDAQRSTADRLAAQKGLPIAKSWTEHESGGDNDRVELDKALRYAKRRNAVLIVAKLDRLSRDSQFLSRVKDSGVRIICSDVPEIDGGASSNLHFQIMANFAEFERKRIGERTREALAVLKSRGVALGAARPQCRSLTDEARKRGARISATGRVARAIEDMQDVSDIAIKMRAEHATLQQIADHLEGQGILTRQGLATWSPTLVKRVLDRAAAPH